MHCGFLPDEILHPLHRSEDQIQLSTLMSSASFNSVQFPGNDPDDVRGFLERQSSFFSDLSYLLGSEVSGFFQNCSGDSLFGCFIEENGPAIQTLENAQVSHGHPDLFPVDIAAR